jgi:hypothetical protein
MGKLTVLGKLGSSTGLVDQEGQDLQNVPRAYALQVRSLSMSRHARNARFRLLIAGCVAVTGGCGSGTDAGSTFDEHVAKESSANQSVEVTAVPALASTTPTIPEVPEATTPPTSTTPPAATAPVVATTPPTVTPASPLAPALARTMELGNSGEDVTALQQELVARGHAISTDGTFGSGTETAVRVEQDKLLIESDGLVGPATRASLALGSDEGSYASADQFFLDVLGWISAGAAGNLPSDALVALAMWSDSDLTGVTWSSQGQPTAGPGDRLIGMFVLGGEGGVYNTLHVCVTASLPAGWCGVWDASFH